jgi:hypothetical protein
MDCLVSDATGSFRTYFRQVGTAVFSILFLIFESEERASNKAKAKYGHPEARSGSELKLKTE